MGQVGNFYRDPIVFVCFCQEVWGWGWGSGLAENFYKDLLVLGHGSPGDLANRGVCSVQGEGGVRFRFFQGSPCFRSNSGSLS